MKEEPVLLGDFIELQYGTWLNLKLPDLDEPNRLCQRIPIYLGEDEALAEYGRQVAVEFLDDIYLPDWASERQDIVNRILKDLYGDVAMKVNLAILEKIHQKEGA